VTIPAGIEDAPVRKQLLDEFNIEIAGGLGPVKGKIWRVGLMGYSCQKPNVLILLAALEKTLSDQGFKLPAGAATAAALQSYKHASEPALAGARK
jgi:aspartate aminotransferase-like enzyme